MGFRLLDRTSGVGVELSATTLHGLMEAASDAFTASVAPHAEVQPRQAEEVEVDAPDLDALLADFLSELLYRYDARRWLTRFAEIEVHEQDDGWVLEGTLRGERGAASEPTPHTPVTAIAYDGLHVSPTNDGWQGTVEFMIGGREL
jgi:SHS2 domain-containing protein